MLDVAAQPKDASLPPPPSEVVEGQELCDLTRIFEPSTQLVIAPVEAEMLRDWDPARVWGDSPRSGTAAIRTPEGEANAADLVGPTRIDPALGRLLGALSEIFATLVGADEVGARWMWTNTPQCPRFHEDNLALRGVYNHCGPGTQWVPAAYVDRRFLGHGSQGRPDEVSGLLLDPSQIRDIPAGTLSVFKGKLWDDAAPVVHRSPPLSETFRFAVTLDSLD